MVDIGVIIVGGILIFIAIGWYFRMRRVPAHDSSIVRMSAETVAQVKKSTNPPMKFIVGDPCAPIFEIERYASSLQDRLQSLPIPNEKLSAMNALLKDAPSLAVSSASATTNMYRLTFSPSVMRSLADGSLSLKESVKGGLRAIAQDGAGKVVEHGNIHPMEALQGAAAAAAVWQVLAMVVGQKFLADISDRLRMIERGIASIKDFLESERLSKLEGSLNYLRPIVDVFTRGEINEHDLSAYRDQFEAIERETLQVISHLRRDIGDYYSLSTNLKYGFTNKLGTDEDTEIISRHIARYDNLTKAYALSIYVRLVACNVSCSLPGDQIVAKDRLREIASSVNDVSAFTSIDEAIANCMFADLKSKFNRKETLLKRRVRLMMELDKAKDERSKQFESLSEAATFVSRQIEEEKVFLEHGTSLVLELDRTGNLIGANRVLEIVAA